MAETDETAVRPDDGRTPDERARSLEPMLTDSDARVRKSAVVALGRIKSSVATELLCRALEDAEEGVRALACQALAREADAACVGALLSHRHDECAGVRAGVLWGLANVVAHAGLTDAQRAELFTPIAVMAFDPYDGVRADAAAVKRVAERGGYVIGESARPVLPERTLASIVRRLDLAVFDIVAAAAEGKFAGGRIVTRTLEDGGVEFVSPEAFARRSGITVPPRVFSRLEELRRELASGGIRLQSRRLPTLCDCY